MHCVHFKKLVKEQKIKHKVMRKKEVVKIRTYINEKENRHIIEEIVKENSRVFEKTIIVKSFFQKRHT